MPALADRGVELIAVSPQRPDGSLTAAEANHLTFAVASDPGNQLAAALGILTNHRRMPLRRNAHWDSTSGK